MKLQILKSNVTAAPARAIPMVQPGSWRTEGMSSTARGYGYRWQQARERFLRLHPLCQCEDCMEGEKRLTVASIVDHRIPHRGDQSLFWDESNWQAMAKPCHDRKTQIETAADRQPLPAA